MGARRLHDLGMEAAATPTAGWGRAQTAVGAALFLCLFAAQAGVIVLTPVLTQIADDLDVSTAAAGQLRTVSGLSAGLAAVALATVARGLSLRKILIFGAAGLGLASLASAAAPSFLMLALAQSLLGVSIAALLIGGTVAAAEWVPEQHRTRVLAWALIGPPAAWIVGMPLVGAIGEVGWRWTWLVLPLVAAVVAGLAIARRPHVSRTPATESMLDALHDGPTARWVLGELLASSAWVGTLVFSGALFVESYGTSGIATGVVLAAGAAAYAAGNVLFRRVVECRARLLLVRLSLALAAAVALFGIVRPALPVSAAFFAAAGFVAGGRTLIGSAVGLEAEPKKRRAVMGARTAAQQLGYFIGSAVGGVALAAGGYPLLGGALGLLFVASALAFLVDAHGRGTSMVRAALVESVCAAE
jgi:predicted MFS family arabinose efflux permease